MSKKERLIEYLRSEDVRSIDIQLSTLIIAASSFRHDSALRPYPSIMKNSKLSNGDYDIESLRAIIEKIPHIPKLLEDLENDIPIEDDVIEFMHWVFYEHPNRLRLKIVADPKERAEILKLSEKPKGPVECPKYIFKIDTNSSHRWEERHQDISKRNIFGYHCTKAHNIYSILSNGLQHHMNSVSLYGQGIYLSNNLFTAQYFATPFKNWSKSILGSELNCIFLCECLDHPDVKKHGEDTKRSTLDDSTAGPLPESYIVVRRNNLITNKYLLVYARGKRANAGYKKDAGHQKSWLYKNKMYILLFGYVAVLLGIGYSQSDVIQSNIQTLRNSL